MDVTDPSFPDREPNLTESKPNAPKIDTEPVDATKRIGMLRRAVIRLRHRHLTNRDLWNLRVCFDLLIEANSWDLAKNFDELNERYPGY